MCVSCLQSGLYNVNQTNTIYIWYSYCSVVAVVRQTIINSHLSLRGWQWGGGGRGGGIWRILYLGWRPVIIHTFPGLIITTRTCRSLLSHPVFPSHTFWHSANCKVFIDKVSSGLLSDNNWRGKRSVHPDHRRLLTVFLHHDHDNKDVKH